MKKIALAFWLLASSMLIAQRSHRVLVAPLDLDLGKDAAPFQSLGQIETSGDRIFLGSTQETRILESDPRGRFIKEIGRAGEGPGEFGAVGVLAMSVSGERVWAIDAQFEWVRLFERGIYQTGFRLSAFNKDLAYPASNRFAFSEDEVVIPASGTDGHLAVVYDYEGEVLRYIDHALPWVDLDERRFRGTDDTFWLFYQDNWICLFKYTPTVLVFDRNFELVRHFRLGGTFNAAFDKIKDFKPDGTFAVPHALVTDADVYRGDLYLMSGGRLNRVSLTDGRIRDVVAFYGEGPDFSEVTAPYLTLFFCRILPNGRVVLGHPGFFWNHDLWTADLLFLKEQSLP